jgi:hypothetical protein
MASRFLSEVPDELVRDSGLSFFHRPDPARLPGESGRGESGGWRSRYSDRSAERYSDRFSDPDSEIYPDPDYSDLDHPESDHSESGDEDFSQVQGDRYSSDRSQRSSDRTGSSTGSSGRSSGRKVRSRLPKMAEERFKKGL